MFWKRNKKKLEAEPQRDVAVPAGIFSTDLENIKTTPGIADIAQAFKKSFQRGIDSFKAVDGNGVAMDSATGMDGLKLQNGGGQFLPWAQLSWFSSLGFIGYQQAAILSQHWLIEKACSMPAEDAIRNGYNTTVNDGTEVNPEVLDYIRQRDKDFQIDDKCVEFITKKRIFGIRIALPVVESKDKFYYEKPFNPDGVRPGSYKGISQIDPYWITPELDEDAVKPGSMHFYEPTWWRINGKRYHRTHLIISRNGDVADILKPTYMYGGIPVPQKIAERVYAAERTANEAPMLALSKRLFAFKMDTTKGVANIRTLEKRLSAWSTLMNNYGIKVLGDGEEITQFDTSLADLDDLIMTQYQLVAAASGVIATKLLETSPKGFNATGEAEAKSYRQSLESLQKHDASPLVERHHLLLMRSEVVTKFKIAPFNTQVVWRPVDSPTAKEQAEINKLNADTDSILVNAGGIDGTDVRHRLINNPDSGYNGIAEVVPGLNDEDEDESGAQTIGEDSAISYEFDPASGQLNGARLITHQRYLNEDKVAEKIRNQDFKVNVSPEFMDKGKKYRMILDGHHSLTAAFRENVMPEFVTEIPHDEKAIINAVTREVTDKA